MILGNEISNRQILLDPLQGIKYCVLQKHMLKISIIMGVSVVQWCEHWPSTSRAWGSIPEVVT